MLKAIVIHTLIYDVFVDVSFADKFEDFDERALRILVQILATKENKPFCSPFDRLEFVARVRRTPVSSERQTDLGRISAAHP